MPKKAKTETVSLEKAAEALVALVDSGNYNNRRYHRVWGIFRDAVKNKGSNVGPIMPDDERPDLDADQEQAVEERVYDSARVHDLVHPGGRMQQAEESIETILEKAEAGTSAQDEARKALTERRDARRKAAVKADKEAAKDTSTPRMTHTSASGETLSGLPLSPKPKGS